jgi:hypothetical protein
MKKIHKHKRNYTVIYKDDEKKVETIEFPKLLNARKFANDKNRENRFVSLTNIKGIKLCL